MFGYVIPNQGELKVRELEEYRAWYCGLCQRLQKDHGILGRISLNYDMTFLALLLSSLYEPDKTVSESNCLEHPLHRRRKYDTVYVGYAAAMNILLTYYKCVDDWKDDRNLLRGGYGLGLKHAGRRVSAEYPDKAETVRSCLEELSEAEEAGETNLDRVSGIFGRICGEIFTVEQDIWREDLYYLGFYLGKFIYLLDAWDDLEDDEKEGSYNPLLLNLPDQKVLRSKQQTQNVREILTQMISRVCYHFERLPLVEDVEIMRNILYSGVWTKFDRHTDRTNQEKWSEKG